jgi:hypothetical protein
MEIYLLVTCLDTLAGKPQYDEFPVWLKKHSTIKDLNVQEINDLYSKYMREHGITKNLRKLFNNLPQYTKEWLIKNVNIREIDQPLSIEEQNPNQLVENLFVYFYNIRRNDYTHRTYPKRVPIPDDIRPPDETGWWITPASGTHFMLDSNKPNKLYDFSYRQGLDEATILRLIIHSATLQKLNIQVTEELINLNLRNFSRLDGFYSFIDELVSNANILNLCTNIEAINKDDYKSYLIYGGLPLLSDKASRRMIDRYVIDRRWELNYSQMTDRYIREVNYLNTLITDFNQKNPHVQPTQDNIEVHWEEIKAFLNEISMTPSAHWIKNLPATNNMTNLWLIIRNPCYI